MKIKPFIGMLTLLAFLVLPATPALAVYTQDASTFSAGGGVSTSASYENLGVIGQSAVIGSSGSSGFTINHGFLSVLGDGFKILYPVIAIDKGSLSFTLASTSSGSDSLAISNSGGSTLNWSIVKNQGSSWLTAAPASGSGAVSVAVSANTAGLIVGSTYNDTLTISGTGIQQTAQVLLSLTVTAPATYRLTVSIVSDNATKGGGTINNGTGLITCSNTGNNPATTTGSCVADLVPGSSITLFQSPDSDSTLATWGGACAGSGNCGIANISGDTVVSAVFPYSFMAKLNSNGVGYESLSLAYAGAAATDVIKARSVDFPVGNLLLNAGKSIELRGGLDAYYAAQNGLYSTLNGILTVGGGSLVVDKLIIK